MFLFAVIVRLYVSRCCMMRFVVQTSGECCWIDKAGKNDYLEMVKDMTDDRGDGERSQAVMRFV